MPVGVTTLDDVSNPGTRLTTSLLPPGPPTAALLCAYLGSPPGALSTHLDERRARQLAAVPLSHTYGPPPFCTALNGDVWVLAFSYPHCPDYDLITTNVGCGGPSNGSIEAIAPGFNQILPSYY